MADDMMKMDEMGERPPMPDMKGANMRREQMDPLEGMPTEAKENLMMPSDEIGAVLMARLVNMSPQELQMLDSAISPDVAKVLIKLLPELRELISQIEKMGAGGQQMAQRQMGALGNM